MTIPGVSRPSPFDDLNEPAVQGQQPQRVSARNGATAAVHQPRAAASWLRPELVLVISSLGLPIVAIADAMSLRGKPAAEALFWAGLLVLTLPLIVALATRNLSRSWRIALVLALGLGVYAIEIIGSPIRFTEFAEMDQLRTVNDIAATHHLYSSNPIAEANPAFPGLSIVVNALTQLTGVSVFLGGLIVISISRVIFIIGLFRLFEVIGASSRVAGLAVALYAANPDFFVFSTQFSYESLGLAFFVLVLLALAWRQNEGEQDLQGGPAVLLLAMLIGGGLIITHHITSFILVGTLATWALISRLQRRDWLELALVTMVMVLGLDAWLGTEGGTALPYLAGVFGPAVHDLFEVLTGGGGAKVPFRESTGQLAPAWERYAGFGSIALILVSLPVGLVLLWRRYRNVPSAILLALIALAYPASLALRLTQAGTEASNRASDFVFIGIGFVLATLICRMLARALPGIRNALVWSAVAASAVVLLAGGITIGTARYARQPGQYMVGADSRSVDPASLGAAAWMSRYEGPGNGILTDRSNRQVMGSYGRQNPRTRSGGDIRGQGYVHVSQLITDTRLGSAERQIIDNRRIRFAVVDRRLSTGLPLVGVYFEKSEPGAYAHRTPIPLAALQKFDAAPDVDRIYDNGSIKIYDLSRAGRP